MPKKDKKKEGLGSTESHHRACAFVDWNFKKETNIKHTYELYKTRLKERKKVRKERTWQVTLISSLVHRRDSSLKSRLIYTNKALSQCLHYIEEKESFT